KEYWAVQLVQYLERRDRLDDLQAVLKQRRPEVAWDADFKPESSGELPAANGSSAPWWDQLPSQAQHSGGDTDIGDVIIATIGAGATGVAVGKNITQNVQVALGPATPGDPQLIEQAFQPVSAALAGASGDAAVKSMADFQLGLLKSELLKPEGGALP